MIAKITLVVALFASVQCGHEAPPPKAHSYAVPSVAKVSYPAPTITKSVETYSAPSIEKTTTITRTITAPLNAPAYKSVQYSAPAAPIHHQQGPILYAAPGYSAGQHQLIGGHGHQQVLYAGAGQGHGHGGYAHKEYVTPTLQFDGGYAHKGYAQFAAPNLGYAVQPALGAHAAPHPHNIKLATTYAAPSLGYNLGGHSHGGHHGSHAHYAPAPVVAKGVAYGH